MSRFAVGCALVLLLAPVLAGCLGAGTDTAGPETKANRVGSKGPTEKPGLPMAKFGPRVQIYDKDGLTPLTLPEFPTPLNMSTSLIQVPNAQGQTAPVGCGEPTGGVTWKNDYIWQVCLQRVFVSKDHGATWAVASTQASSPTTLDPYMWVDTNTDRVYSVQLYVACSYLAYSDDYGTTWIVNPVACGIPANDHQTLAGGPPAPPLVASPVYKDFLYYCVNQIADTMCARSYDGGLTFTGEPAQVTAMDVEAGRQCSAINGHVTVAKDGTVYLPKRTCNRPSVMVSTDNGLTWTERVVSRAVGVVQSLAHDPTITADAQSNAYYFFTGDDGILHLSVSKDKGKTWSPSVRVSPPGMSFTLFETSVSGDTGRVAVAYYGTFQPRENADPSKKWTYSSNAPNETVWNLYLTISQNALDDNPLFTTVQVNVPDDPIQRGCVWLQGGGSGCRNLLDFFDTSIGKDGRVYIHFPDGCTAQDCIHWDGKSNIPRSSLGTVAIEQSGPSLFDSVGWLRPFDALAPAKP